ncbi:hypothetical protein [Kitasatospora griseola]|uniref:hypothetical protein n=1 Tax=Kitasatospora griseola TaxID=2064 RepID=UPI003824641A
MKRCDLTDRHIRVRRQRLLPMVLSLVSVAAGIILLHALGAPSEVSALVIAMLVGLVSSLLVTTGWQISLHNSVAGGTVMILVLALGPWLLLTTLGAAAIDWSRMVLKAHTLAQILASTALSSVTALVFGPCAETAEHPHPGRPKWDRPAGHFGRPLSDSASSEGSYPLGYSAVRPSSPGAK